MKKATDLLMLLISVMLFILLAKKLLMPSALNLTFFDKPPSTNPTPQEQPDKLA